MLFISVIILFALIALAMTILGGVLLFGKMKLDTAVTATVSAVTCEKEDPTKCNITLTFDDKNGKEITRSAIVKGPVTVGSTRGVLYDSANPNNFYPGQPPVRQVGAGLFFGGIAIALGCGVAAYYHWRPAVAAESQAFHDEDTYIEEEPSFSKRTTAIKSLPSPSLSSSPSPSSSSSRPSPETERAKQYADYMVDRVTESSRKMSGDDDIQFK